MNELADTNDGTPQQPRTLHWAFYGKDGLRAGWGLLLFFVLFALISAACAFASFKLTGPAYMVHRGVPMHPLSVFFYTHGSLLVAALLAALVLSRLEHRPMRSYGLGTPAGLGLQILSGLFWGFALFSLLILVLRAKHLLIFDERALSGAAMMKWGAAWFVTFSCVAVTEEYLMRGYPLLTLSRGLAGAFGALGMSAQNRVRAGFWCAAVAFSLLFALAHGNNPGESPIGLWAAGIIGLVFSFSLWRTGSLWWAVAWHAAWDWAESFVYGTADSGGAILNPLWHTHVAGNVLLSGGPTGPEGSVFVLPIILLTTVVIAVTLKPQPGSPSKDAAMTADLPVR